MQYKLVSGKDPFELNPGLRAIAKFNELTDRQMFFVILVADTDWDNPLRTFPEKQRREKAAIAAGYLMEADGKRPDKNARDIINGKLDKVEKAIAEYRNLHFDEDEANLAAINQQIQEARELMQMDKEKAANKDYEKAFVLAEKAMKLGQSIHKLVETRDATLARIKEKKPILIDTLTNTAADVAPDGPEDGDSEESTIDKYMSRVADGEAN